jgi:hypothetical protein
MVVSRVRSGEINALRRPQHHDKRIVFAMLFHKTAVVAVPMKHKLAVGRQMTIRSSAVSR